MRDQASTLRQMYERDPDRGPSIDEERPTLVIASGKGGVGKSVISALLAIDLARSGHRTLLLEGSQNLGSLQLMLGVQPAATLEDFHTGYAAADDLLTPVVDGLWLLAGNSGAESLYALGPVDRARLHYRLNNLYEEFDTVVIDAGSGIDSVVRVASMRATRLILLTVPEPAALINAYAVLKIVHMQVANLAVDILVNRVSDDSEAFRAFERLKAACEHFLLFTPGYLGAIPEDHEIRAAVKVAGGLLECGEDNPTVLRVRATLTNNVVTSDSSLSVVSTTL